MKLTAKEKIKVRKMTLTDKEKIKKIIGLVAITLFIASMIWMVN